jgi:hypothetical protein
VRDGRVITGSNSKRLREEKKVITDACRGRSLRTAKSLRVFE